MYFSRQNTEDLINMRREPLEAFTPAFLEEEKKQAAVVMTETAKHLLHINQHQAGVFVRLSKKSDSVCSQDAPDLIKKS